MTELKEERKEEEEIPKDDGSGTPHPPKSDSILVWAVLGVIIALLAVVLVPRFLGQPPTLEELHEKNLNGRLPGDEGYSHNLYSFVRYDDLWYTKLTNPAKTRELNIPFHYGPREVADLQPHGLLNYSVFQDSRNVFVTFDPLDDGLKYIGVAVGEADSVLINAFGKGIIPACTRNETAACAGRPIVDCDSSDEVPIIYFATENETALVYLNNCVIIAGQGEELWRATDRMLFDFLGIQ